MSKISKMFGLNLEKPIEWNELDPKIREFLVMRIIATVLLFIAMVILEIILRFDARVLILFCIALLICVLSILKHYISFKYSLYSSLQGQITHVEQPVKERPKALIHPVNYGKSFMNVDCGGFMYEIPINHSNKYKSGLTVEVYYETGSVIDETADSAKILNPILIIIQKIGQ